MPAPAPPSPPLALVERPARPAPLVRADLDGLTPAQARARLARESAWEAYAGAAEARGDGLLIWAGEIAAALAEAE